MGSLSKLKTIIESQQQGHKEYEPGYVVGLQLIDIAEREPSSAEILINDLETSDMTIFKAAEKIKQYADKNRGKETSFCVTPNQAEKILREFYGLASAEDNTVLAAEEENMIDLADFLG